MGRCRSCKQIVRWVSTAAGKNLPLDPTPVDDGNIMVLPNGRSRIVPIAERAACVAPLYKSHFATCHNAAQHRRPR